ncbi:hypothetical protein K9B32_20895 [Rhizobium sp. 3T7]|uniref:hypothetical protein n=1 Tax=Rhizobium sp. 3T7 TaxID=2874922 RepID=UPI001CC96F97|nr:hypothetical protein [Rhizobium sp. 3T7]MBZ9792542.1 hypothetical protein [Rhizobium sp. 3T7]
MSTFSKAAATGLIAAALAVASIVATTPAMAHGHGGGHGGGDHGGAVGSDNFRNDHGNFAEHNDGFAESANHTFGGFHRFRDNGWDDCYPGWRQERHVDTFQRACD